MSSELVWQLTRDYTSTGIRRTHPVAVFTTEKGAGAVGRKSKTSGLANVAAVDVSPNDDGVPVLSLKNKKAADARKPDQMWSTVVLSGGVRKALAKTDKALSAYHPGCKKAAMAKVSTLYRAKARMDKNINASAVKTGRSFK